MQQQHVSWRSDGSQLRIEQHPMTVATEMQCIGVELCRGAGGVKLLKLSRQNNTIRGLAVLWLWEADITVDGVMFAWI